MKMLICVLATSVIAGLAPSAASAADLGPYDERETVIERPAPVVVERRYYEPYYEDYYDDAPVVDVLRASLPPPVFCQLLSVPLRTLLSITVAIGVIMGVGDLDGCAKRDASAHPKLELI